MLMVVSVLPATMLREDRWSIFLSAATLQDGSACKDSLASLSSPGTACNVQAHGQRRFCAPYDIQRNCLMGVAAEAPYLKISVARVKSIGQSWGGLGRALVTQHPIVPGFASEFVRLFASFLRALRRVADRTAVEVFAGLRAHLTIKAEPTDGGKLHHRLGSKSRRATAHRGCGKAPHSDGHFSSLLRERRPRPERCLGQFSG